MTAGREAARAVRQTHTTQQHMKSMTTCGGVPDTTAEDSIIIRKWGGSVGMVVGVASHGTASWRWLLAGVARMTT